MERLSQLWNQILAQLSVLNVSQRLAIGLCVALVVVSFLWLTQWSSVPAMVPLINRDFAFEDLDAAELVLRSNGIDFETRGMRILVPAAMRYNAQRLLVAQDALPASSLFDMESVVSGGNPFQSPEARQYAQNYAKGNELAKIIATSPYINSASVLINPITKRRLGGHTDVPTASVTVSMRSGKNIDQAMVEGFAKLVAGAVAGLKPHNVSIIDGRSMRSFSLPHPDDASGFDVFTMVKRREEHYREKIQRKLIDIPGLQVGVTVQIDTSKRVTQNIRHAPPTLKKEETDATDQSSTTQATAPGVSANLGQAITARGSGEKNTTEKTITENFEPKLTQTETIEQLPFATKKVTATIGIPRSYITGVFLALHPDAEPNPKDDNPVYVAVRNEQIERVRSSVELIVMANNSSDVDVDVYPDMDWSTDGSSWSRAPGGVAGSMPDAGTADTLGMIRTYGSQAALAGFALMSLVMMMRIVRKSTEVLGAAGEKRDDTGPMSDPEEVLTVGAGPVGEAEVSQSMLAGQEVEPEALRYQQLGQEVAKMVEQDAEGTAGLVQRWIDDNE